MEKKSVFHWTCCCWWSLLLGRVGGSGFRRCSPSRRNLIVAGVCVVYLFFVVSQIGYKRVDKDKYRLNNVYNLYNLGLTAARPEDPLTGGTGNNAGFNDISAVPTLQSNVVYITLKSNKRLKPAVIRGTVKPKLRRKDRRRNRTDNGDAFTHNKASALERVGDGGAQKTRAIQTPWKETRVIDYGLLHSVTDNNRDDQSQHDVSSIRTYGHKAPPWFSAEDVRLMRFLADAKVLRIKEVSYNNNNEGSDPSSFLLFESDAKVVDSPTKERDKVCQWERCGVIKRPVDTSEVFAFHLDRVLGMNRTLPAVSRSFSLIHDGRPCAVVSWDPSLYPGGLVAARPTVVLTWKEYQSSLKQRCWHKNVTPKSGSGCSTIHHHEWSKVAVFDFLLQIYNRLDRSCCGFRPRHEDLCVETGQHAECDVDRDRVPLANIVHRADDPRRLVFTDNKGFFDRNEDNLDFRILEGIRELPERAVGVLRTRKLRERLLQSLFMDQVYWESQGGRRGIDKLIDVIEKRVSVLHTYINAHGIKVIPMNA